MDTITVQVGLKAMHTYTTIVQFVCAIPDEVKYLSDWLQNKLMHGCHSATGFPFMLPLAAL